MKTFNAVAILAAALLAAAGPAAARRDSGERQGRGGDGRHAEGAGHGSMDGGGRSGRAENAPQHQERHVERAQQPHVLAPTQPQTPIQAQPQTPIEPRPQHGMRRDDVHSSPRAGEHASPHPAPAPAHGRVSNVRDQRVYRSIERERRVETTPGRYYRHNDAGVRYTHYYDRSGAHWYGFNRGQRSYWTRYHGNHWWWWDGPRARWVFWYGGYWWWRDPSGATYYYAGDRYYPYAPASVAVVTQNPAPPAQAAGTSWKSPDGSREVMGGTNGDAFLYDTSGGKPAFMRSLGRGAKNVRYSGGKDGKALTILLDYADGSFALFDAQGLALDAKASAAAEGEAAPAAPGEELPGAPPSQPPPADEIAPPAGPPTPPDADP